jgi:hypothetical protein
MSLMRDSRHDMREKREKREKRRVISSDSSMPCSLAAQYAGSET